MLGHSHYNGCMSHVIVDPESRSLEERHVLIRTPRKNRKRYPEACVQLMPDAASAQQAAQTAAQTADTRPEA